MARFPQRIVCLTEESVEFIYALGLQDRLVGVSAYAVRPPEVKQKTIVSTFTHAQRKKILDLKPDLVVGFSDIQKDIAKELIEAGLNVFISNQRSLEQIFDYLLTLGGLLGESTRAEALVRGYETKLEQFRERSRALTYRPRVYLEEWDDPLITGIGWFSELVEATGGNPLFRERSLQGVLASDRFVTHQEICAADPEVILACWCGKPVQLDSFKERPGYTEITAMKNQRVFELRPEIFLQPGPALFEEGLAELYQLFERVRS